MSGMKTANSSAGGIIGGGGKYQTSNNTNYNSETGGTPKRDHSEVTSTTGIRDGSAMDVDDDDGSVKSIKHNEDVNKQ